MATSSASNALLELVGPELYEAFFGDDIEVGGAIAEVGLEQHAVDCELDRLLLEASENYEQKHDIAETQQRFAFPKTEKEVVEAKKASVPKKTQQDTNYCVRLWNQWKQYRNGTTTNEKVPEELIVMFSHAARPQLLFMLLFHFLRSK